jgi:excisionase family DNA binding protein
MGAYINSLRPRVHLTVEEAALKFGVPSRELEQAIRTRKLRFKRVGHHNWITATAVDEFLKRQRTNENERAAWNTGFGSGPALKKAS